jgi:hypothetical protein
MIGDVGSQKGKTKQAGFAAFVVKRRVCEGKNIRTNNALKYRKVRKQQTQQSHIIDNQKSWTKGRF